ncbi:hypothetical protein [Pseudomonas lini]
MNINIKEERTTHGWVVHMDALAVNFNSLEAAKEFVGQLKARIEAPHVWPMTIGPTAFAPPTPGLRSTLANDQKARAELVK